MSSQLSGYGLQKVGGKKCSSNVKQTRLEPQGQETNGNTARFPSNISSDSIRYVPSSRSLSEVRNPMFLQQANGNPVKDSNSNRSSMDASTCSYSTIIIHNDENLSSLGNKEFSSPPPIAVRDRPRSYGETGMQEITEIPDDYLNQSHVLKHLAKEMKIPSKDTSHNIIRDFTAENTYKNNSININWNINPIKPFIKTKSKSLPDLTKFFNSDNYNKESIKRENTALKQQLVMCRMKVSKTQKLEDEVTNVYRVYEELVQSCERREKLERVARLRLQENLQKVQTLNRALKDQVDIFQTQLLTPSEHQLLVAQLFTQNKELLAAKERQDIELSAQQATLQEQRTHIGILDTALNNAQRNIRRLEEELRKKQVYIDRINPTHGAGQLKENDRKMRLGYDSSKDSNLSGSSTNSDSKWQLQEKSNEFMSLDAGQKNIEDESQTNSKICLEKETTQETERIIAEVKHDKLRYLEDVLHVHLKGLENRLTEKDALIRALQNQKICGSSFDSYNLSTDSFPIHALRFNSPKFINTSNTSFHTNLLDQTSYGTNSSTKYNPVMSNVLSTVTTANNYAQTTTNNYGQSNTNNYGQSNYTHNAINLHNLTIPGSYSPNSSTYSASFDQNTNSLTQNSPNFNSSCSSYENHYDDHMKKHIDEQLNKVSQLSIVNNTGYIRNYHNNSSKMPLDPVNEIKHKNNLIFNQLQHNCKADIGDLSNKETFY